MRQHGMPDIQTCLNGGLLIISPRRVDATPAGWSAMFFSYGRADPDVLT